MYFQNPSSGVDHFCLCLSSCDLGQVLGNSEFLRLLRFREENEKGEGVGTSFLVHLVEGREPFLSLPFISTVSQLAARQRRILATSNGKRIIFY